LGVHLHLIGMRRPDTLENDVSLGMAVKTMRPA
jgi:hypothetical protein